MIQKSLAVMDVDISARVAKWGSVEQVMSALFGTSQAFVGEITVTLENHDGAFGPGGQGLVRAGVLYGAPVVLTVAGQVAFQGQVVDLSPDEDGGTAQLVAENVLKEPARATIAASGTANPGEAMLAVLSLALDATLLDARGFLAAGGPARAAGATVAYDFPQGQNITALAAAQQIADLAGIALLEESGRLTARAFIPYPGDGAGLRFTIDDGVVRDRGQAALDRTSFDPKVSVGYPGPAYVVMQDPVGVLQAGNSKRSADFSATAPVHAANRVSAEYFASAYLARAGRQRLILPFTGGPSLALERIGYRYPVARASRWPLVVPPGIPAEAISVRVDLDQETTALTLASLDGPLGQG